MGDISFTLTILEKNAQGVFMNFVILNLTTMV